MIYVAKHWFKSKGKGFVLIGLCFVGKIGLVKSRGRGGCNPHKTMCSHCPIVLAKILYRPNTTLGRLHFVQTVLDHLPSDLICSPLVKHLLRANSAIWLKEVRSELNCWEWWCLHSSQRVWCLLELYDAHERGPLYQLVWFTGSRLFLIPAPLCSDHTSLRLMELAGG